MFCVPKRLGTEVTESGHFARYYYVISEPAKVSIAIQVLFKNNNLYITV